MQELAELREKITEIDTRLLDLFEQRFALVQQIGEYKKINNLPIHDEDREKELVAFLKEKAKNKDLSSELIEQIWQAIFQESYKKEK